MITYTCFDSMIRSFLSIRPFEKFFIGVFYRGDYDDTPLVVKKEKKKE